MLTTNNQVGVVVVVTLLLFQRQMESEKRKYDIAIIQIRTGRWCRQSRGKRQRLRQGRRRKVIRQAGRRRRFARRFDQRLVFCCNGRGRFKDRKSPGNKGKTLQ